MYLNMTYSRDNNKNQKIVMLMIRLIIYIGVYIYLTTNQLIINKPKTCSKIKCGIEYYTHGNRQINQGTYLFISSFTNRYFCVNCNDGGCFIHTVHCELFMKMDDVFDIVWRLQKCISGYKNYLLVNRTINAS